MDNVQTATVRAWVQSELVIAPMHARDAFDAITQLGERLQVSGHVKPSFIAAVIAREKIYATGLPTAGVQVAIPHTDVEHVLRDAIAVGVLAEPVTFGEMGNPDGTVEVSLVCLLAATQAESVVTLLQRLAGLFQHADVLQQIVAAHDPATITALMNQQLSEAEETV